MLVMATATRARSPRWMRCGKQQATDAAQPNQEADIIVTGFRASLDGASNVKRTLVAAVDAIVAEDIASSRHNLAESLERIPGISIQRDGGEGRAISVRGLGAQFTRVRVNGMERSRHRMTARRQPDRAFDFNVFASELFNSIVVHKTASASLDEGRWARWSISTPATRWAARPASPSSDGAGSQ